MRLLPDHKNLREDQRTLTLVALGFFFLGCLITGGVFLLAQSQQVLSKATGLRESDISIAPSPYKFIDPLIGVKGANNSAKFSDLSRQVQAFIDDQKNNGLIIATVDFRDINESGGFVLNPGEQYVPASLNKVPVMMAYYKLAEKEPSVLSAEIPYVGINDHNKVEEIKSSVQLTPGVTYTVQQLIEHMIRYSDNNAADLLLENLKHINQYGVYTTIFSDMGIDPGVLDSYTDNMTAQKYAIFLRSLYNATYLSRDDSERALQLLSKTDFSEGIESGVPNNILVAEKFGEVRMTDSNGTLLGKEINNCGIIYYPEHPYLLCVMTKGTGDDIKGLENDIASISRIVYKGMQNLYP
jgi:beta-lactamase class A